jgi:hypothetical protein
VGYVFVFIWMVEGLFWGFFRLKGAGFGWDGVPPLLKIFFHQRESLVVPVLRHPVYVVGDYDVFEG